MLRNKKLQGDPETLTEFQIKFDRRFSRPQSQSVYDVVVVSWDWAVVRHGEDDLRISNRYFLCENV